MSLRVNQINGSVKGATHPSKSLDNRLLSAPQVYFIIILKCMNEQHLYKSSRDHTHCVYTVLVYRQTDGLVVMETIFILFIFFFLGGGCDFSSEIAAQNLINSVLLGSHFE